MIGEIESSIPFPLNGRPFISNLYPKGSLNNNSPNCLLPAFGTVTGRNPPHSYRSCMAGYGRLRSQRVKGPFNDHSSNCLLAPFGTSTCRNPPH
ncbi:hypothetical protein AVEN_195159-1 [Araneus ventricosus]|uniref:Uncharacterized protein n=1 Tax=Araneus ventricosus TaxID=182803 RepID=A0A4Y2Q1P4_ARAVE|nr:hypothetical protein AVEN_195159-1 [Araneus ventricosus]